MEAIERSVTNLAERLKSQSSWPRGMSILPDEPINPVRPSANARGLSAVTRYGMARFRDVFTPRQCLSAIVFAESVRSAHEQIRQEESDSAFARAVTAILSLLVDKMIQRNSSLCRWNPSGESLVDAFARQALPMVWDFGESSPFSGAAGDWSALVDGMLQLQKEIERSGIKVAQVHQGSATSLPLPDAAIPAIVTDPPYYDQVPYADLSDFFYVWLCRMIGDLYPELFREPLTPKGEEIIVNLTPLPQLWVRDHAFFEKHMQVALSECQRTIQPDGIAVIAFAHRTTSGWESLLKAMINSKWTVTGSWPLETEMPSRMRARRAASLASSVWLVCRPRPAEAGVGDWRRVLEGLRARVHDWLPRLAREGIEGADAIFSCIGPALEVYSRYERVETAAEAIPLADVRNGNGQVVKRGFLSFLWEAIAREAMTTIAEKYMEGADPTGFEEDSRLTAMWLWTLRSRANGSTTLTTSGPAPAKAEEEALVEEEEEAAAQKQPRGYALPYDDARLIIQGLGANEDSLRRPGGILEIKGETARLVGVAERRRSLMGKEEGAAQPRRRGRKPQLDFLEDMGLQPVGEDQEPIKPGATILDRLHQAMLLFADGRSETLRQFLVDGGVGKDDRFWRLATALYALYPPTSQEKRWVGGVIGRGKALGLY
jgi:adenine-specific DNA methylase